MNLKKLTVSMLAIILSTGLLFGCGAENEEPEDSEDQTEEQDDMETEEED